MSIIESVIYWSYVKVVIVKIGIKADTCFQPMLGSLQLNSIWSTDQIRTLKYHHR